MKDEAMGKINKEMMKPHLEIMSKDLPDIKKWDVGKTYNVALKMKMTKKMQGGYEMPDDMIRGEFEVISAKDTYSHENTYHRKGE